MIIYFSATGNCKYVATRISEKINDTTISMIKLIDDDKYDINLDVNESLGIIIPTYFWGLPIVVDEFLSEVKITSKDVNPYIYVVTTYGTTPGYSAGFVKEHIREKGYKTSLLTSVKMVDTWSVQFNLSDNEKINEKTRESDEEINEVLRQISTKSTGNTVSRKVPKIISNIGQLLYDRGRKTKHLHLEDNCIECALCAKQCPIHVIDLVKNRPVWNTEYCLMCLRCLHNCPVFAIQYDNKTRKHGQYINPHIKILD